MVRCLPLAVLALLAVALPAAAEDPALPPPGGDPSLLTDAVGVATEAAAPASTFEDAALCGALGGCASMAVATTFIGDPSPSCQFVDVDIYHLSNAVTVDPDGCLWALLRRTLGWPPVADAMPTVMYDLPAEPSSAPQPFGPLP